MAGWHDVWTAPRPLDTKAQVQKLGFMVIYIFVVFLNCTFILIASCACIRRYIYIYIYIDNYRYLIYIYMYVQLFEVHKIILKIYQIWFIFTNWSTRHIVFTYVTTRCLIHSPWLINQWLSSLNKTYCKLRTHIHQYRNVRHVLFKGSISLDICFTWRVDHEPKTNPPWILQHLQSSYVSRLSISSWWNPTKWNQHVIPLSPILIFEGLCQQPIREEMYHFQPKLRESHAMCVKSHRSAEDIEMKTTIHQRVRDGTFPYTSHSHMLVLYITTPESWAPFLSRTAAWPCITV